MIRWISSSDVEELHRAEQAGLDAHISAVAAAFREVGTGKGRLLPRQSLITDIDPSSARPRSLKVMGAALPEADVMGIVTYPAGYGRPLDFRISLNSLSSGAPLAILEGEAIAHWATASVTAAATDLLARPDAQTLGLIGTGRFAFDQPRAISRVRELRDVRCYSRDAGMRADFARRLASVLKGVLVRAVDSAEEAADGADILTTVTTSHNPVVASRDVADGVHINAIGMHYPKTREVDGETVKRSRFFADDIKQTFEEKGEFQIPLSDGIIEKDHLLGDLGDLVSGRIVGRRSADELTMFGSGGTAIEFIGAAKCLYDAAVAKGIGTALHTSVAT